MDIMSFLSRILEGRPKKFPQGDALVSVPGREDQSSETQEYSKHVKELLSYKEKYDKIPLITAIVDTHASQVITEFYFEGPNKEKLAKFADDKNIENFLFKVQKAKLIYGNAFVEVVKKGGEIEKLKLLNPVWICVFRDKVGKVLGYGQVIKNEKQILWGTTGSKGEDSKYKKIIKNGKDSIVHFKHNIISSEKYGTSIIKPLSGVTESKNEMENHLGSLLHKYVAPLIWAKVGSDEMPAQDEAVSDVAGTLRDLHAESEIVTSHLVDLQVLTFDKKGMDIKTPLEHIDKQIVSGGQVPPILLGIGGSVDKAAEVQLRSFGRRIRALQRETKIEFEDQIIVGLDLGTTEDKLMFSKAEEREWEIDTDILRGLVTDGVITAQKANDLLPPKYQEKLPEMNPLLNQQGQMPGGQQIPRPSQMKNDKVKDKPNDPTQTTKNKNAVGRVVKTDRKPPIK